MRLIKPKVEILDRLDETEVLLRIANVARTCYKSEGYSTVQKDKALVKRLIDSKHDAMLEFVDITVKFITDRAIANCNYSKDKFGNELTFIIPSQGANDTWVKAMKQAEKAYLCLTVDGWTAEQARAVLPLCTKTEINMKANLREWRHFFRLRCSKHAHPDMRVLALDLLKQVHDELPTIFEDIYQEFYGTERQDN